ncbi:MAG TPA: type IX secretion system protein PorQ [Bacteroidota bacterium]|nr:type IX secretion system protein PorQ [Bacteroidota bacterium]
MTRFLYLFMQLSRFQLMRVLLPTIIVLAALFIPSAFTLRAQDNSTYNFLGLDVGARAAALGGGFVTMTDDPNAIFYNPAGLGTLTQRRVSFGFLKHLLDINAGHASFGTEVPNLGFVGAGIVYINYGEFNRTGEEGEDLGTFGAGELAMTVGYAGPLQPGLTYGVNAKFIYSSIAEARSSAAALDFGVQYLAVPDRMTIGASLLNLGTQLDPYFNTRENLPLDLRIGVSLYPEHLPAVLMVSLDKVNEHQDSFGRRFRAFAIGVELAPGPNVHLRVGYNNERRQDFKILSSSGLAGFSIGGGINTEMYNVDYAFSSFGQIGAVHRVTISF